MSKPLADLSFEDFIKTHMGESLSKVDALKLKQFFDAKEVRFEEEKILLNNQIDATEKELDGMNKFTGCKCKLYEERARTLLDSKVTSLEEELRLAKGRHEHTQYFYAVRFRRLTDYLKENGHWNDTTACIYGNGTGDIHEPPRYAQMMNVLIHRAEDAERRVNKLIKVCETSLSQWYGHLSDHEYSEDESNPEVLRYVGFRNDLEKIRKETVGNFTGEIISKTKNFLGFDGVTIGEWRHLHHDLDSDVYDSPEYREGDMFLVTSKWRSVKHEAFHWKFQRIKVINGKFMLMNDAEVLGEWEESWGDIDLYARITEIYK